jgi:hypothetical protein
MCSFSRPSPPPAPLPIPSAPPIVTSATTKQKAPTEANNSSASTTVASNYARKRQGRGTLRIPLASSGSGLNFPTA